MRSEYETGGTAHLMARGTNQIKGAYMVGMGELMFLIPGGARVFRLHHGREDGRERTLKCTSGAGCSNESGINVDESGWTVGHQAVL
jgi:hypothetical protein